MHDVLYIRDNRLRFCERGSMCSYEPCLVSKYLWQYSGILRRESCCVGSPKFLSLLEFAMAGFQSDSYPAICDWSAGDWSAGDWSAGDWPVVEAEREVPQASMQQMLWEQQIPEQLHKEFLHFSPREFGMVATDLANLDVFIQDLPVNEVEKVPKPLIIARIRLLWQQCKALSEAAPLATTKPSPPVPAAENGWVEVFPKKLGCDHVKAMVARFRASYPSEPLSAECMPSARLLALVAKQLQDKHWRYVPWKYRLSEEQQEKQSMTRPAKAPRLESLLFDDVPTRDIPTPTMGKCLMQELLHLQAVAIAMCGGAHLYTLREMNRRFINKCFEKFSPESGLRGPSVSEAQDADQKIWQQISTLFNEEQWTLDEAIHEVVVVRSELQSLLTPRPFVPKALARVERPWQGLRKGGDKGGHKGKGDKGAGKGSGGRDPLYVDGFRICEWYMRGKAKRALCKDFQQGKCSRGDACKFDHLCGVMINGKPCLQPHPPSQHKKTPH